LSEKFGRRAALFVAVTLFIAASLFMAPLWPQGGGVRAAIQAAGAVCIAIAVLGRTWTILYIDGNKYWSLVTAGPYSLCRNPLYFFSFFGAAGAGAASGSLVLALLALAMTVAVFRYMVALEERLLAERFGADFDAYTRRTRRFVPAPGNWEPVDKVEVRPEKVVRTFAEALLFALAFPAYHLIFWVQEAGLAPVLMRLP